MMNIGTRSYSSFIIHHFIRRPESNVRTLGGGGEELGEGLAADGVSRVGDQLGEWGEDEAAEVEARVGERERVGRGRLVAVEQQV